MLVAVAYVACALIWGTSWFVIRVSMSPEGYPAMLSAALRFSLAAALLAPVVGLRAVRPLPQRRSTWLWLAGAGLLNAATYSCVYLGEQYVSGGLTAVLFATTPLFTAVLVTATRSERVTRSQLVGALLSLAGVLVIYAERTAVSADQAWGVSIVLVGVGAWSLYTFIVKSHAHTVHPVASTAVFLAVTAGAQWGFTGLRTARLLSWPPPLVPTLAIVHLAVLGSIVAFGAWFYLIKHISLMAASMLSLVLPIIALIMDALWEHEAELAGRTYLGIGLTLTGVFLDVVLRAVKRSPPGAPL